jgi:hypothetical protein
MLTLMLTALLGSLACTDDRERACHTAVKSLVAAPDKHLKSEMAKVVAFGTYALPDIEQEMHGAPIKGRLRLLDALRRIGSAEAVPLLDFLIRVDTDDAVRKEAGKVVRQLRRPAKKSL